MRLAITSVRIRSAGTRYDLNADDIIKSRRKCLLNYQKCQVTVQRWRMHVTRANKGGALAEFYRCSKIFLFHCWISDYLMKNNGEENYLLFLSITVVIIKLICWKFKTHFQTYFVLCKKWLIFRVVSIYFASTYSSESLFSRMNAVKSKRLGRN